MVSHTTARLLNIPCVQCNRPDVFKYRKRALGGSTCVKPLRGFSFDYSISAIREEGEVASRTRSFYASSTPTELSSVGANTAQKGEEIQEK
ncbi:hypothetical protein MTO96_038677 [Rhipicephalus appendiculatus]